MKIFRPTAILLLLIFQASCDFSPAGSGCRAPFTASSGPFLGSEAPNFTLPDLSGEPVELARLFNEKPVLIIFWATWCPTCREEIPVLNEWIKKYPHLQILAVNVQEPAERVRAFAEKEGIRYPVVLDQEAEVAVQYGLVGVPASILIARGGRILYYGFALPRHVDRLIQE
ncbi:MAG: TlpA family protein disulfide reductase [Candidatus Omnitrophica bacterium]|nr:TlpA family protein disulfide reductase [Candidatus Omnitrophota bacterium]